MSSMTPNSILTNTIYNPQYLRLMHQFSVSYYRRHSVSGNELNGHLFQVDNVFLEHTIFRFVFRFIAIKYRVTPYAFTIGHP